MKKLIILPAFIIISSCNGWFVNEKTSEICDLTSCCNPDNMWKEIYHEYKVTDTLSPQVKEILDDFKSMPFDSKIIYFEENPPEYIGIGRENGAVRYVYNEKLAPQVLDGLAPQLPASEKIRIALRLHSLM